MKKSSLHPDDDTSLVLLILDYCGLFETANGTDNVCQMIPLLATVPGCRPPRQRKEH